MTQRVPLPPDAVARRSGILAVTRQRWMGALFAVGSTCFLVAPFPGFAKLVGGHADELVFFIGSIFFTAGGAVQSWLAWPHRTWDPQGRAAWRAAVIQSAGTLFFNVTTFMAISTSTASDQYNRLVWRPDALGSICFLISGAIAYYYSPRRGWLPAREASGLVGARPQPARLHLLRHQRRGRLRRSLQRVGARPRGGELEHLSRRCCAS